LAQGGVQSAEGPALLTEVAVDLPDLLEDLRVSPEVLSSRGVRFLEAGDAGEEAGGGVARSTQGRFVQGELGSGVGELGGDVGGDRRDEPPPLGA
jgi:hypothetical protein